MIQCDTTLSDLPVVLIVEDEPLVRLLATEVLADAGIRTIEPCNADEALTLLEAKPDMAALVTDVKMPGSMDGFSLSRLAAMRWPHLGIVVSSAGSRPGEGDLPEGAKFLPKPYQLSSFVETVRQVMGSGIPALTVVPIRPAHG